MATIRPITRWKPLRFFPLIERRTVAGFMGGMPNVMVDMVPAWAQYRFRKIGARLGLALYLLLLVAPLFPLLFIALYTK